MAKFLLISDKSLSVKDNRQMNDIVGVFDNGHAFSPGELKNFKIVVEPDLDKGTAGMLMPQIRQLYKVDTTDWTLDDPQVKDAWLDDSGNWKEIKVKPFLVARFEDGQIKENFSRFVENNTILIPVK